MIDSRGVSGAAKLSHDGEEMKRAFDAEAEEDEEGWDFSDLSQGTCSGSIRSLARLGGNIGTCEIAGWVWRCSRRELPLTLYVEDGTGTAQVELTEEHDTHLWDLVGAAEDTCAKFIGTSDEEGRRVSGVMDGRTQEDPLVKDLGGNSRCIYLHHHLTD